MEVGGMSWIDVTLLLVIVAWFFRLGYEVGRRKR